MSVVFPVVPQLLCVEDTLEGNRSDTRSGQQSGTKGVWVGEGETGTGTSEVARADISCTARGSQRVSSHRLSPRPPTT